MATTRVNLTDPQITMLLEAAREYREELNNREFAGERLGNSIRALENAVSALIAARDWHRT